MDALSTVDGFINVKEGVEEMIKYIANEPSVGLFFVQQHAHSSMPNLLNIKDKLAEKVYEVTLHTEDTEDSICMVKSMTECGIPIAGDMIKDITTSLGIMSVSQPKRGYSSISSQQDEGNSRGYLSAVLNSAKQKAASLRRSKGEELAKATTPLTSAGSASSEADELPLSSTLSDVNAVVASTENHVIVPALEDFDKFRFDREAKLKEWLQEEP